MCLYFGILFDLAALGFLGHRLTVIPVHTEHLIERVGCLTIILLGESVISLSAGLADITWNIDNLIAAVTGFVMVSSIWWIYFDSFYLLTEKNSRQSFHSVLASVCVHRALDSCQPDTARDTERHAGAGFSGPGDHWRYSVFCRQAVWIFYGVPGATALPDFQHPGRFFY
jgi:hypothetical protein